MSKPRLLRSNKEDKRSRSSVGTSVSLPLWTLLILCFYFKVSSPNCLCAKTDFLSNVIPKLCANLRGVYLQVETCSFFPKKLLLLLLPLPLRLALNHEIRTLCTYTSPPLLV